MSVRIIRLRAISVLSAYYRHSRHLLLNLLPLLACFACIYLSIFVSYLTQQPAAATPAASETAAAAVACIPPRYQGFVNSCSGLRLLWLPGSPVSQVDHMELKRYNTLIASSLPANSTGYSDLQGCDFASAYEIVQVMKDGTRCSTVTRGSLPHSFPCDKCSPVPTPTPGPTPTPTPQPTPTPTPGPMPTPTVPPDAGIRVLNAASYGATVAPGSIASIFGSRLTNPTLTAFARLLPEDLGGTRVTVNSVAAKLLYVSPQQINLILPDNIAGGSAQLVITSSDGSSKAATANVQPAAPGIFTMQSNGTGVPAGLTTSDGIYYQPVGNPDGSAHTISVGTLEHPMWLVLFVTGVRGRSSLQDVKIYINGLGCTATYAGPQPGFDGLDQINIQLPQSLRNNGNVEVEVQINRLAANITHLTIGG